MLYTYIHILKPCMCVCLIVAQAKTSIPAILCHAIFFNITNQMRETRTAFAHKCMRKSVHTYIHMYVCLYFYHRIES